MVFLKTMTTAAMGIATFPLQGTAEICVFIVMASIFESMTNVRPGAKAYCLACILFAAAESLGISFLSMVAISVAACGVHEDITQAVSTAKSNKKRNPGGKPPSYR